MHDIDDNHFRHTLTSTNNASQIVDSIISSAKVRLSHYLLTAAITWRQLVVYYNKLRRLKRNSQILTKIIPI